VTAAASTPAAGVLDVGDTWLLGVEVRDDDTEELVDATVAITVTKPDDSTSALAVDHDGTGAYSASYVLTASGRHFAVAAISGAVVSVVTFAVAAMAPGEPPTVDALRHYLQESGVRWTDPDLADVLAAETENQADLCRIDTAVFPAWARQALLRRCMRALAMRSLPLAMPQGDAESGPAILPWKDPEVTRLERPHRKVVFA
jgi:hypothetical protein